MKAFINTLPGVFDAIEASDEARQAFVFAAWRNVAGDQVFARTMPLSVNEDHLVIAVSDKTWKRNLETLAPQLIFKLNSALGKPSVNFIEFRVSPDDIIPPTAASENVDVEIAPPVELSVSSRKIRDESLRNTVLHAAANCLARHR